VVQTILAKEEKDESLKRRPNLHDGFLHNIDQMERDIKHINLEIYNSTYHTNQT